MRGELQHLQRSIVIRTIPLGKGNQVTAGIMLGQPWSLRPPSLFRSYARIRHQLRFGPGQYTTLVGRCLCGESACAGADVCCTQCSWETGVFHVKTRLNLSIGFSSSSECALFKLGTTYIGFPQVKKATSFYHNVLLKLGQIYLKCLSLLLLMMLLLVVGTCN